MVDSCSVEVSIMLSIFTIDKHRFHVWVTRGDTVTLVLGRTTRDTSADIFVWFDNGDTHS